MRKGTADTSASTYRNRNFDPRHPRFPLAPFPIPPLHRFPPAQVNAFFRPISIFQLKGIRRDHRQWRRTTLLGLIARENLGRDHRNFDLVIIGIENF